MPLSKIQFKPGINKESTTYANEGTFYTGNWVRFRSGYAEKIGGWINLNNNATFSGVARSIWSWVSLAGAKLLGIGTSQKYYIENGGTYYDITPIRTTITLDADPFTTVNGSKLITVVCNAHGASTGSYVTFTDSGDVTVGGILVASVAGVQFEILTTPDGNTFTIVSSTAATSDDTGGTGVDAEFLLNAGSSTYTTLGGGWGTGSWGEGGWGEGVGTATGLPLRLWSQCNYGEDLVMAPRGGEIYYWEVDTSTYDRAVTLSSRADTFVKVVTPLTTSFSTAATTLRVLSPTGIDVGAVITGTGLDPGTTVTSVTFNTTNSDWDVVFTPAASNNSSGDYSFSYVGDAVPNQVGAVFKSDVYQFVIALGANPYDPTNYSTAFNPMLIRWADQDNVYEWIPATANQSGEQLLSNGSYLVTAINTRQEILIWSDAAIYSMQYLGPPYVWGVQLLSDNISIASPNAAITAANVTYWMGLDKFYVYTGRVETLPCALRQWVFGSLNKEQVFQIVSGTNEGFNEVWWYYPTGTSTVNDSYVVYNYLEQVWYYGSLVRTAWNDSPLRQSPMAAFSIQTSYLDSAISDSATTITLVNGNSYPVTGAVLIDSEYITYAERDGNTLTGCVRGVTLPTGVPTTAASHDAYTVVAYGVSNQIMYHEDGNDDQSGSIPLPIYAYIGSADFDIGDGHQFGFVTRILPDLTFAGSTTALPDVPKVNMTVEARINSGTTYTSDGNPTVYRTATYPVEQYTGQVYVRIRGRQMRYKIESTDLGVAWQIGAMRIDIRPDGRKV